MLNKKSNNNMQYFFGKSLNIDALIGSAVDDLLYQMYYQNADIQRAIGDKNNLIFEGGYYFVNSKDEKVDNQITDFINYALNSYKDFEDFKKEFNYYRNIFGNVYTHLLTNTENNLIGLQNLDPRMVTAVTNEFGIVTHYTYNKFEIPKSKIVQFKNGFDPNNKLKGMSPLVGGILDILGDNEAARSNFMFFLNNSIPAGLIKFSEGVDDDEMKLMLDALHQQFAGGNNQHKIGGIKGIEGIEKLQKEFKDMEYKILRDFSTEKVATCLGVPLTRLNKSNVTYNNMKESFEQYIEATIINEERDLANHLNRCIAYQFNTKEIKLAVTNDHVDNATYLTDILIKQIENGIITPAMAAGKLGYEVIDEVNQSKLYIKSGITTLEDAGMPMQDFTSLQE